MPVTANEPKLNIVNLLLGLFIVTCTVCYGFASTIDNQAEYTATTFNTAAQISTILTQEPTQEISAEQVQEVFTSQANIGIINSLEFGESFTTAVKIIIIVCIALGVFMMTNMCGLVPRFGAES